MAGHDVPLPNPISILPFLGLFVIVILKPEDLVGCRIPTLHLPALSILQDNRFILAPDGTLPGDENAARIFDVLGLVGLDPVPDSDGSILLSPEYPAFPQQRFWQLPSQPEAILSALMTRVAVGTFRGEEIRLARAIYFALSFEAEEFRSGSSIGDGFGSGRGHSEPGVRGGSDGVKSSAHERNLETLHQRAQRMGEDNQGEKGGLRSRPLETAESGLSDNSEQSFIKSLS
jgi:hypothetical protein